MTRIGIYIVGAIDIESAYKISNCFQNGERAFSHA